MSFDFKLKNGDLVISNGDVQLVENSEKLTQDLLKICLTPIGANPLYSWYGSLLSKNIIGTTLDEEVVVNMGKNYLVNAIENLKELQILQIKEFQPVSTDELIQAILKIDIRRDIQDFRLYIVNVTVLSAGSKPITTSFRVSTI